MYTISLPKKQVYLGRNSANNERNKILDLYEEVLTKAKIDGMASIPLAPGERQRKGGTLLRSIHAPAPISDWMTESTRELPAFEAKLDPIAHALYEQYLDYITNALQKCGISADDIQKDKIDDTLVLVGELFIRLVIQALRSDANIQIKRSVFVGVLATFWLQLDAEKFLDSDKSSDFRVQLIQTHMEWITSLQSIASFVETLNKPGEIVSANLDYLKEVRAQLKRHLILALVFLSDKAKIEKNDWEGKLAARFLNKTLEDEESKVVTHFKEDQRGGFQESFHEAGSMKLADETYLVTALIITPEQNMRQQKVGYVASALHEKRYPEIKALYQLLNKTLLIIRLVEKISSLIQMSGWIPMILNMIDLKVIDDAIESHKSACEALFSNSVGNTEKFLKTPLGKAFGRHKIALSYRNLQSVDRLAQLKDKTLLDKIHQFILGNLRELLSLGGALGCKIITPPLPSALSDSPFNIPYHSEEFSLQQIPEIMVTSDGNSRSHLKDKKSKNIPHSRIRRSLKLIPHSRKSKDLNQDKNPSGDKGSNLLDVTEIESQTSFNDPQDQIESFALPQEIQEEKDNLISPPNEELNLAIMPKSSHVADFLKWVIKNDPTNGYTAIINAVNQAYLDKAKQNPVDQEFKHEAELLLDVSLQNSLRKMLIPIIYDFEQNHMEVMRPRFRGWLWEIRDEELYHLKVACLHYEEFHILFFITMLAAKKPATAILSGYNFLYDQIELLFNQYYEGHDIRVNVFEDSFSSSKKIEKLNNKIARLENQIESGRRLTRKQHRKSLLSPTEPNFMQQNSQSKSEQETTNEIAYLKNENAQLKETIDKQQEDASTFKKILESINDRLSLLQDENEQLKKDLAIKDGEIKSKFEEYKKQLEEHKKQIFSLQETVFKANNTNASLKVDNDNLTEKIKESENKISELTKNNEDLESTNKYARDKLTQLSIKSAKQARTSKHSPTKNQTAFPRKTPETRIRKSTGSRENISKNTRCENSTDNTFLHTRNFWENKKDEEYQRSLSVPVEKKSRNLDLSQKIERGTPASATQQQDEGVGNPFSDVTRSDSVFHQTESGQRAKKTSNRRSKGLSSLFVSSEEETNYSANSPKPDAHEISFLNK